jgi:hypothetical protein
MVQLSDTELMALKYLYKEDWHNDKNRIKYLKVIFGIISFCFASKFQGYFFYFYLFLFLQVFCSENTPNLAYIKTYDLWYFSIKFQVLIKFQFFKFNLCFFFF